VSKWAIPAHRKETVLTLLNKDQLRLIQAKYALIGTGINNNANSAFGNIKAKATMIPYMAPEGSYYSTHVLMKQILDYLK
jgi:hypothetical protein